MSPDILQKIAQLTLNREEESLMHAFFPLMRSEFPSLLAMALFKVEVHEQLTQAPEVVYGDDLSDCQAEITELVQQLITTQPVLTFQQQEYNDVCLLVRKANREKHCLYFMVYMLDVRQIRDEQIETILSITEIYSNHQEMISLNDRDSLTGLYNRKAFDQKMVRLLSKGEHRRSSDSERFYCFAIIDIDYFKKINDAFGHLYGDEVLLHFAQQAQDFFRQDDLVFRYGGEEFVVILKNVEEKIAKCVFERFRNHIENYYFPQVGSVTISIGMTRLDTDLLQSEIIDRADHALYYIKEHGRNAIGCYETLVEEGKLQPVKIESDIELF